MMHQSNESHGWRLLEIPIAKSHGSPLHRVLCCIMPAVHQHQQAGNGGLPKNPIIIGHKPPKTPSKPSKIAKPILNGHKTATISLPSSPAKEKGKEGKDGKDGKAVTDTPPPSQEEVLGLQKLLSSLSDLQPQVQDSDLDLHFIRDILESPDFQTLAKVHDSVSSPVSADAKPVCHNAMSVLRRVTGDITQLSVSAPVEAQELLCILNYPHFEALLTAHDRIATKDYHPVLPDVPYEVDEDDESTVKIVQLIKGPTEPLGATIQMNDSGAIKVARILNGGAADRSGMIHAGDEVHEVNGEQVTGRPPDEVIRILTNAIGPVTLKLVPGDADLNHFMESKMTVRAHFSYDPSDDKFIPCPEVGLGFQRGDILHIVSQDDPLWWQARRASTDPSGGLAGDAEEQASRGVRAGLIPGRMLAERCSDSWANKENKDIKELKNIKTSKFSPKLGKRTKKPKKIQYHTQPDPDGEPLMTYEEVERLCPRVGGEHRPVVLVGAPGVGRSELRRRLINSSITHFKQTIPYTTRHKKSWEMEGDEFHFISKSQFDKNVSSRTFLEYGEFKGHHYGISLEQIKSIIKAGHVCIACPQPQSIRVLRRAEYKPFVIFIKSPCYERLKETRCTQKSKFTQDEKNPRTFADDELREIVSASARIEATYGHLFDHVIVNEELPKATNELVLTCHKLETDTHWLPVTWSR